MGLSRRACRDECLHFSKSLHVRVGYVNISALACADGGAPHRTTYLMKRKEIEPDSVYQRQATEWRSLDTGVPQ